VANPSDLDKSYAKKLDLNLAEYLLDEDALESSNQKSFNQLKDTLTSMLYDGFSIKFLSSLLTLLELESLPMSALIKRALNTLCGLLKSEDKRTNTKEGQSFGKLKLLLDNISTHLNECESERKATVTAATKAQNSGKRRREYCAKFGQNCGH
jgi:hypothetical protein